MNFINPKIKNCDENTIRTMNIVLSERKKGKSRNKCAEIAKIKPQRIQNWYNEGKNGFGEANIRFYKHLSAIEDDLIHKKKYSAEINEFNCHSNKQKRIEFIKNITNGQTRKEASKNAHLNLKLATKWDSLGKKGIKPFKKFHIEYKNAREQVERAKKIKNDRIKNQTIKYINSGKTIEQAAKLVKNGEYEKTILNWYAAGKSGNKNHISFYNKCNKKTIKPVNSDILGPLPRKWKKYFENKPMNQTGIAWVNKVGNNYIYQRQCLNKNIRISDPDIYNLHKKVIAKNYVWGIRDINKARKIIKKENSTKSNVTVTYQRKNKNTTNVIINGTINTKNARKTLNKLKFFDLDKRLSQEITKNNKTEIKIVYELDISLVNSFNDTIKKLGWKIKR